MTPERWRQIQSVFHEALQKPLEQRTAFLREVCAGDSDLHREVKALLAADDDPASILALSPETLKKALPARATGDEAASRVLPSTVGPYRILREIGRGGMGAVYLAERADGQFSKQVALKLVKRGMDTDEIVRRFRRERQILAGLEHPHIARLYDGGVTDDGRPYIVMEYVDGRPIDRFCDEQRLPIEARLGLFETVAEAVRFAHQNLIVHRDLKPSNILVHLDAHGAVHVKLLDFGIAKMLDEEAEDIVPATRPGFRALTPGYAAPEQLRGAPITTATDIYALGVILYELLTGRHPHRRPDQSSEELEQAVLHAEPERPSALVSRGSLDQDSQAESDQVSRNRGTTVDRLRRRLRGDLNMIVLKALQKEPERRYASAEALLDDLERYRTGLPVTARPDAIGYRFRRLVARHRLGFATATIILLLLIGTTILTRIQQAETARQRDRAQQERDKAEEVATFLASLFNASDPFLADTERLDTLTIRDFLDRGALRIRHEMENQPALRAEMLDVIGNVYRNLGLYETARPILDDALEQRRGLYGPDHPEFADGLISLARASQAQGDYDDAERKFREALALYRADEFVSPAILTETMNGLASVLRDQSRFDEAETLLQEALTIHEAREGEGGRDLATVLLEMGRVHQDRGNLVQAESLYRQVVNLHREILGENHPELSGSLENLATTLRQQARLDDAEPLLREALALRRRVLGPTHPLTVTSTYELASLMRDKEAYEQAVALFKDVLELDKRALGADHHYVGLDLRELGTTYARMDRHDLALATYESALTILRNALSPDHNDIAVVQTGIGNTYLKMGLPDRAEPILRDVLERRRATLGDDSWWTGVSMSVLGECLMRLDRHAEAETLLVNGYETLRDANGPTEAALHRLIAFYEETERADTAAAYRAIVDAAG